MALTLPDDDRQIRLMTRTPNLISHSALPLQSPFEQPPVYTPPQPQTPWSSDSPSSTTSTTQSPGRALFSPHHPLRPMGGPVSVSVPTGGGSGRGGGGNGDSGGGIVVNSPVGLTVSVGTPATPWGRQWGRGWESQDQTETAAAAATTTGRRRGNGMGSGTFGGRTPVAGASTWGDGLRSPRTPRAMREEIERVPVPHVPVPRVPVPVPPLPTDVGRQDREQQAQPTSQSQQQQQQQQQNQRRHHHQLQQPEPQQILSPTSTISPLSPPSSMFPFAAPPSRSETMDTSTKDDERVSQYEMGEVGLGLSYGGGGGGGGGGDGNERGLPGNHKGKRRSRWRKWSSPGIMAGCLLAAIAFSLGHHGYYSWLDGQAVGGVDDQLWVLRLGNLFAVAVGLALKVAVGNAYFQFLWGHLKRTAFSLGALNNLFDAAGNLLAIFNPEIIKKATVGFFLATLLWALPLVSVFPAATLSVAIGPNSAPLSLSVPAPAIGTAVDMANTSSSPYLWAEYTNQQTSSPLMNRIVQVATVNGELAPPALVCPDLERASANLTYEVEAYVPRLRCDEFTGLDSSAGRAFLAAATAIVRDEIGTSIVGSSIKFADDLSFTYNVSVEFDKRSKTSPAAARASSSATTTRHNGTFFYAGLVSALDFPEPTLNRGGALVAGTPATKYFSALPRTDSSSAPDGGLLFALAMPAPRPPVFVSCRTYNSSVRAQVDVVDSRAARVTVLGATDAGPALNFTELGCASGAGVGACPQMTYQFWLRSLASYVSGLWWSADPAQKLSLDASPHQTGLGASVDLWDMLQRVSALYGGANPWDAGRVRADLGFAAAVEELSLNASLSFMSEPSLSREVGVDVDAHSARQVYVYRSRDLAVSYGLYIALAFCAVAYGGFTYAQNGRISHENLFSSIAGAAQHPAMARLATDRPLDGDEVDARVYQSRWRLGGYSVPVAEGDDGKRFGFVPMDGR